MFTFLVIILVLLSIAIGVVVLSQAAKGDGLSGALGGPGSVGAVFGVRRTSDFLQRTTIWLSAIFIGLCLIANIFFLPDITSIPNAVSTGSAVLPKPPVAMPSQSAPAVTVPSGTAPAQAPAK